MNLLSLKFNSLKQSLKAKFIFKSKPAFTLIEILVSVTLFTTIMLSATSIFKLALDAQRKSMMAQNTQESLRYFLEVIGKEMRMAQRNNGVCPTPMEPDEIYHKTTNSDGDVLYFKNYHGQCVHYYALGTTLRNRFVIGRKTGAGAWDLNFITPARVYISNLKFEVKGSTTTQAFVTVAFKAEAISPAGVRLGPINMQTSVSSRYYLAD